jgi:HSP20 family protein
MRFGPLKEELSSLREQVGRILEDTFASGTSIQVDIYQTDEQLILVTGGLIGLNTASLDISIMGGNQITIEGETSPPSDIATEAYVKRERRFGKFSRSLTLPVEVLAEQAKASYKHNILTISIPKVQTQPKVVKVSPLE